MNKQRGYAIPLSLCVAGVTLFLGLSVAQMSAGDLQLASHQYYQERARQVAEYGLERCVVADVPSGSILTLPSVSNTHPGDSVCVTFFAAGSPNCPVTVPAGFEYWVAEGRVGQGSRTLASARVGALVRFGQPGGSAGAQIKYMLVDSGSPVDYRVVDAQGNPVPDEAVIATEASALPVGGLPGFTKPITLNQVSGFAGKLRIPQGAPSGIVDVATVPISHDGGPINLPEYSPPSGQAYVSLLQLAANYSGLLPPAHYGTLEVPADAVVRLNGVYHIDNLRVLNEGAAFRVEPTANAKVFVDRLDESSRPLTLINKHLAAGSFRLMLKENASAHEAPPVALKVAEGGGVTVWAPGRRLQLTSDNTRVIRGSFSSSVLHVTYPPGPGNAQFVYDISATTARRSQSALQGGVNGNDNGGDVSPPTAMNAEGGVNTHTSQPGVDPIPGGPRMQGNQPMILSRQSL